MYQFKRTLTVFILLSASFCYAQPGSGWNKVFSDEFNSSSVDESKWQVRTNGVFRRNRLVMTGSALRVLNTYTNSGQISGGWIQTKNGFSGQNKYGYYEARVRINGWTNGAIWPTWWIWGGNWRNGGPAPSATEFDLMEYSGFSSKYYNNKATTSHHYKSKRVINGKTHITSPYASTQQRNPFEWHTWGMLWTPTEVSFWYDGVKYMTSDQPGDAASENVPMNLIFSSSPHTSNADPEQPDHPTAANAAQPGQNLPSFEIDWVRVYRGGNAYAGGNGGNTGSGNLVTMRKSNADFAIDGNWGGADGQNVYLWSSNNNNVNQQWEEISQGNGFYSYKKRDTNYCLDGDNGGSNGQNVYLWSCVSNNQNQHWKKVDLGNGKFRLEKRNASGYSLDGDFGGFNGQNLYLWASDNSNPNQQWQFGTATRSNDDFDDQTILLYPNPVVNSVTLSGVNKGDKLEIYNLQGALLSTAIAESDVTSISVEHLNSGSYLIMVFSNDRDKTTTKKFVKQ